MTQEGLMTKSTAQTKTNIDDVHAWTWGQPLPDADRPWSREDVDDALGELVTKWTLDRRLSPDLLDILVDYNTRSTCPARRPETRRRPS
jgi:hypothetical protein